MAEEFYSFEKALEKLKLREEELRRLVSEGEIRAYRSGETMKLRREDVEKLQKELAVPGTGEVVDLEGGTEELIFSEEEPAEVVAEEPGMETAEISEEDTLVVEEPKASRKAAAAEPIELAEEVEEAPAAARVATGRRARPLPARPHPAAKGEPASEGMLHRVLLAGTALVLILGSWALIYGASGLGNSAKESIFGEIGKMFSSK